MTKYYSDERNVQVVLALLKEHGIRKVIASPGTKNMSLVVSMQNDLFFELYSAVDERSAAYMACGLAAETGEPVVLSCTGATASRNYLPGLTEAFYRKLPILAITSAHNLSKVGHNIAQIIDRSVQPKDAFKFSITLPIVKDDEDNWDCEVKANMAFLELTRHGGGPVHINLPTKNSKKFETKNLPFTRVIKRVSVFDHFPELPKSVRIAVLVGAHANMTHDQTRALDAFCACNNSIVLCDHTSGYKGRYRVLYSLVAGQLALDASVIQPDILIQIGEVSGDYYMLKLGGKQIWRVSEDGEIRDTFKRLTYVFEMPEITFFEYYSKSREGDSIEYLETCKANLNSVYEKIPLLPFSNIWIASRLSSQLPEHSTIHFGILNSLRSWNFFEIPHSVASSSNVGGFGIDGNLSSLIGASLANQDKLYFGVLGDLAFFYDMNVLGNRHTGRNLRILLINNGKGTEFRHFSHHAAQHKEDADEFIAAAGHFGNKSRDLVRHYAQDLGFEYITASDKDSFEKVYERFVSPEVFAKSILFEVFTNSEDESEALKRMLSIEENAKGQVKYLTKQILGTKGFSKIKKVIGK